MKTKLVTIALTIITTFSLTAFSIPEASAQTADTCKVQKNNAKFFVRATEKFIKLKKGTLLLWTIKDMQQGLIVVKAKIGKKWVLGEILLDDTTCK